MIDISGYSLLTSNLIELGKISSEVITRHIGDYLKEVNMKPIPSKKLKNPQIIDVVEIYGGDITRFLGDGFLATFGQGRPLEESIHKAASCCLHIMQTHPSCIIEKPHTHERPSQPSQLPYLEQNGSYRMTLHVAVAAGPVEHVILGNIKGRMDYVVNGECLHELGLIIDEAKSGELGVSLQVWNNLTETTAELKTLNRAHYRTTPNAVIFENGGLKKACEMLIPSFVGKIGLEAPAASSRMGSSEILHGGGGVAPRRPARLPSLTHVVDDHSLLEKFVNQSLLHKIKQNDELGRDFNTTDRKLSRTSSATDFKRTAIQNEFRQLSIVFVKLDFQFKPKKAQMILTLFLKCIALHGGVFQQYSVDDKGQTMLAFFGLPPYTHENDARRALKASAEFIQQASSYRFGDIYVSVSTGDIMFASIGSEYRSEASFLGDAVNVAARVIGLKIDKRAVVCDENTRTSAEGLAFKHLGQFRIKGKSHPLDLYTVTVDSFGNGTTMRKTSEKFEDVGYSEERKCLVRVFKEWCHGEKQGLAMVEGASGMGKSRLMESFCQVVHSAGVVTCLTRGSEVDQWTPYSGLRDLFQHIYQKTLEDFQPVPDRTESINSTAPPSTAPNASQTTLDTTNTSMGDSLKLLNIRRAAKSKRESSALVEFLRRFDEDVALAPLLGSLLPNVNVQENEQTKTLDGKARKGMLAEMVVRILSEFTAENRVVFVFDDSQWLDLASLDVLTKIVNTAKHSFFVFFTRPIDEHPNDSLKQLRNHSIVEYMYIKGFTMLDIERLIMSIYGSRVQEVSSRLVQAIFDRSGGSPLASGMMLEAIKIRCPNALAIEEGKLFFDSNVGVLEEILSGSLAASITIQFDRYLVTIKNNPLTWTIPKKRIHVLLQEFLKKSSILGQYFRVIDALSLMETNYTAHDALDWIAQHDRFRFLIVRPQHPNTDPVDAECYFRHIAIMNTIYDSLPFEDRQRLHLSAGRYFEMMMVEGGGDEGMLPTVGFHFYRSGDIPKTVVYLEKLAMLSMSHANLKEFQASFSEATTVLTNLNKDWPRTKRQCNKMLIKAILEQRRLYKKTNGGIKAYKPDGECETPRMLTTMGLTHKALMYYVLYSPESVTGLEKILVLFWNLNSAIKVASADPGAWATLCFHIGVGLWWKLPALGRIYINCAIKAEQETGIQGLKSSYGIYLSEMLKMKESIEIFDKVIEQSVKIGDLAQEFMGRYFHTFLYLLRGDLKTVNAIWVGLGDRVYTAVLTDFIWPNLAWCSFVGMCLLQNNMVAGETALEHFKKVVMERPHLNFSPNYTIGRAWIESRNGNPQVITRHILDTANAMEVWNDHHNACIDAVFKGVVVIWILPNRFLSLLENRELRKGTVVAVTRAAREAKNEAFQMEHIQAIRKAVESIAKKTRQLNRTMPLTGLFGRFYDAAIHLYRERGGGAGRRKGVRCLKKILGDRKLGVLFQQDLALLKAFALTFAAAYTNVEKERRVMSREAGELLAGFGATFLLDWLGEMISCK
ncbi:hypothetical protein HDU97_000971 [Phlyctochytrium planicorne]|nr:hypothetical protein HDU97_000971 [Phlyctochytrium planicorne]